MQKPFLIFLTAAVLGAASWGILEQLRAQDNTSPTAPEVVQRRVMQVFAEKQDELFKNPDVLGVVPQPGNGTIKIITDRPANVPKEVEGVPVETAPLPLLLPPPPGVILLRPGGVIERREDLKECPKGYWEYLKYPWRFCQPEGNPQVVPNHLMNPPIAGIPFEEAEKIYHRHSEELMQIPGTISVGLGAEGIVVRTDHPELVPSEVEGLPVKTEPVTGMPRRMSHTVTRETNPFHGGTSVAASTTPIAWGTSSGVVLSEGKPWIVSVSHILAQCDGFPICAPYSSPLNACPHYSGETIVQSPEQNPTTVGRASRWTRLVPDPKSKYITLAQSPTEIPPRCALPPFFKGGQGGISSRSVMKCANLLWSDLVLRMS
jgi:hypothetical protein